MSARILVTGAQGFLGRYLVAQLLRADPSSEVLGLGRSPRLEDSFTHSLQWGASRLKAPLPDELRDAFSAASLLTPYRSMGAQGVPSWIGRRSVSTAP